jgi:phosphohistidine phosphatase
MKTLYLVRHAKSDWTMEGQPDIDRPLNERGYLDAHLMSKHLYKENVRPDLIISSPAIRAMSTALIFAGNLRYSKENIRIKENLYETGLNEYIECIHSIENAINSVMLFGHNPVISEAVQYLMKERNEEMSTCAVCRIDFEASMWNELTKKSGHLSFYLAPSLLKAQ